MTTRNEALSLKPSNNTEGSTTATNNTPANSTLADAITCTGKRLSPSCKMKPGRQCSNGWRGKRHAKKKDRVVEGKEIIKKLSKRLAQESKQQLELALVELEQIKKEGVEKAKLSEDQLMEKDQHITALKGKPTVLKGNDLLVSALKSELEIKSNAYSKLQEANEKLRKRVQQYNKNVCQQKMEEKEFQW